MFSDFISLLFPRLCAACDVALAKGEKEICTTCQYQLPRTNYHRQTDNELDRRFWGKARINRCMAYLKYHKGGKVQQLLYKIKYANRKEAAELVGKWYGSELREEEFNFDLIVPVPLHPRKLKKRGYNPGEFFAKGLAISLAIGHQNCLCRNREGSSQTNKSRYQRWENIDGIYEVKDHLSLQGKHILLVDDVVTTGATLDFCAQLLLEAGAGKVSIAAIASAQ